MPRDGTEQGFGYPGRKYAADGNLSVLGATAHRCGSSIISSAGNHKRSKPFAPVNGMRGPL